MKATIIAVAALASGVMANPPPKYEPTTEPVYEPTTTSVYEPTYPTSTEEPKYPTYTPEYPTSEPPYPTKYPEYPEYPSYTTSYITTTTCYEVTTCAPHVDCAVYPTKYSTTEYITYPTVVPCETETYKPTKSYGTAAPPPPSHYPTKAPVTAGAAHVAGQGFLAAAAAAVLALL
jgi:hypothetical protein